ncbi:MAG TPA: HPr kinase/phosphatase C-terminal domain-containing protein [Pseudolabrys sp.]|nr:HPr kinase/phosphatase C-terminal domain-containing protein [Pseudolabrys sp.]
MAAGTPTVHASAVLVGSKAALIRGASGTGKSKLVLDVIAAAAQGALPFARLVGDDRVHVEASGGRVLVRPVPALAGLIEARGLGVRRLAFEPVATVGFVVDLAAEDAERLPDPKASEVEIAGIRLPRLAAAPGIDTLSLVLAWLRTPPGN